MQGAWDEGSAGGALGRSNYFTNPQYSMVLTHAKTKIHIQVEAPKDVRIRCYGSPYDRWIGHMFHDHNHGDTIADIFVSNVEELFE